MTPAINPQKALSALQSLDPNMPRDDWYRVCAAARAAGLEFDSFDQWSASGASYNPSDCRSTWQSLPPQDGGIGVATLFGMAAAGGWRWKPQRSAKVVPAVDFSALLNKASAATDAPTEAPQTPAVAPQPAPAPQAPKPKPHPLKDPANVWARALPATLEHPYCRAKGVTDPAALEGLRVLPDTDPLTLTADKTRMAGALLVPIRLPGGELQSVQCIPPTGPKLSLPGSMENGYHVVGTIEPGQPVYIVEGIGAAWAVHAAGGAAVVTFGVGRTEKVAATVQAQYPGSPVVLLPDVGQEAKAAQIAQRLQCAVATLPGDLGDNADAWDYWHAHGTEAMAELLAGAAAPVQAATDSGAGADPWPAPSAAPNAPTVPSKIPGMDGRPAYVTFDDWYETPAGSTYRPGVWLFGTKTEGKGDNAVLVPTETWICTPLHITAGTADARDGSYGRLLRFKNTRGNWKEWAMPMHMLAGDGTGLCEVLFDLGMLIGSKPGLTRYLQSMAPEEKGYLQCVLQPGWADSRCRAFALPDTVIGPDAAGVVFQSDSKGDSDFGTAGTLEGWQAGIGAMAIQNPMLALAICTGFAGPLLAKVNAESGGPHLIGASSIGKSSALAAACSVWGSPAYKRTWRATSNGLESVAAGLNDCLLALDEISECDPKDVGPTVYMVGNGQGKQRAGRDGGFRSVARWRVSVLSNGEFSIGTSMAAGGHVIKAGQEVRFFDVPCGDRAHGVWDVLHHHPDARAFSDAIKDAAKTHYGHAGRAFVERLASDPTDFGAALAAIRARPELATTGEGQEQRVAGRFAVLALAGELASSYRITGWPPGEAIRAAAAGLNAWRSLQTDKDGANRERGKAVQDVADFIDKHGDSRFSDADALPDDQRQPLIHNRAGYWRNTDTGRVFLFTTGGMREALKGHDFGRALGYLQAAGMMPPTGSDGKSAKVMAIQGKRSRWYEVRPGAATGGDV